MLISNSQRNQYCGQGGSLACPPFPSAQVASVFWVLAALNLASGYRAALGVFPEGTAQVSGKAQASLGLSLR